METITFHCKVITPMFLAGADGQTPELRAPSIKGAMRFWWRALNGHLVEKDEHGRWDYAELRKKEGAIFGDTSQRSSFSLTLEWINRMEGKLPLPDSGTKVGEYNNDIFKFMTYGLWDNKDVGKNRVFIGPGSTFSLTIQLHSLFFKSDILQSLYLLVNHGGIGAKARNGFGGINVSEGLFLEGYKKSLDFSMAEVKDFSCFSRESKVVNITTDNTWMGALFKLLEGYVKVKDGYKTYEKNFIAAHSPKTLGFERKPKFCFYKISTNETGKYIGKVTFLPYLILKLENQHLDTLNDFITQTEKTQS